ncbi:MAG TPA: ethanolamine ammonia-lyase reactivating factor EutA, partial [Nocardioidaceae bacterium]|nr:ethanolamine ammonia-lyase reactivating factor EutA [Nocardioidaceae bacterium]
VVLTSIGVDIGSAGTQVAFSRLHLRRSGESLSGRYVVVRREALFESGVALTPYLDERLIDAVGVGRILDTAYHEAGCRPQDVDTGVVLLTGEALRRENAERIADVVADKAGDFVCTGAGHHLEARLAAYGSGAVRISHDDRVRVLNVDIGGGTTKLTLADRGRVVATAALHVGGRLVVVDDGGTIVRLEPAARDQAATRGLRWALGERADDEGLAAVAAFQAQAILAAIWSATRGQAPGAELASLMLTEPIVQSEPVSGVVFSGGVSEFIYGTEERDFGDLGRLLGEHLRDAVEAGRLGSALLAGDERMRATVLGAAQHTVQLSGITSFVSAPDSLLPRRSLPVVRPRYDRDDVDAGEVATAVERELQTFDAQADGNVVLALTWIGPPEYSRLRALAEGLVSGLRSRLDLGQPLYAVVDADIARTLGCILRTELGVTAGMVVLDGLTLHDFDHVDIGAVRQPSGTIPVTIKSLVFRSGEVGR